MDAPGSFSLTDRCRATPAVRATIRQRIVEADLVDCMVALPPQLFYEHADSGVPVVHEPKQAVAS